MSVRLQEIFEAIFRRVSAPRQCCGCHEMITLNSYCRNADVCVSRPRFDVVFAFVRREFSASLSPQPALRHFPKKLQPKIFSTQNESVVTAHKIHVRVLAFKLQLQIVVSFGALDC